jgi:hypothetical protein
MTWKDCPRAALIGALAMAVDVLILAFAGAIQALALRGQDLALASAAAASGEWAARIAGPYALGLLVWLGSRARPDRNPCVFALWAWIAHFAMYGAVLRIIGAFTPDTMMTMALKLVGALIGASLAMTSLTRSGED